MRSGAVYGATRFPVPKRNASALGKCGKCLVKTLGNQIRAALYRRNGEGIGKGEMRSMRLIHQEYRAEGMNLSGDRSYI